MSMAVESVPRIGGVALVRADGAVLLQLRDNKPGLSAAGQWVLPGGHCEPEESCLDCARREFREETGYDCAELYPLTEFFHTSPDTGRRYWLSFWWTRYDGTSAVRCFEGQEVRFVRRDEAAGKPMPDYLPAVWDAALAAEKKALRPR
jgi:8-oxo-dGTP pyrophosphatase MutT (NUDIX family)